MLQVTPGSSADTDLREKEDDAIYCAACGHLVTRTRWAFDINGGHEHMFFNPAGIVFRVLCFREAPGAAETGDASDQFTWFKGYDWRLAICNGCGDQLGWRFEGASENDSEPAIFFALIKGKLTSMKPVGD